MQLPSRGYTPKPSATRRGQQVDNPPLRDTDTQTLRFLLQDATHEQKEQQELINKDVELRLRANHLSWVEADKFTVKVSTTLKFHWIAIGLLATALFALYFRRG